MDNLKKNIKISDITTGHIQGIATDAQRKYMYYSFTTSFIKTDMDGNIVGSVKGLAGHLGCIAYNYDDGRVYASLEYKHDGIGTYILERLSEKIEVTDGFYIAIFDVDKIDRMDMDAQKDGVMTAVYLDEVLKDYSTGRYGCGGMDGITFAPVPGDFGGSKHLYLAYGVYGDVTREDNDYQVILRYDIRDWKKYENPLNQLDMHTNGPAKPDSKYFVYTGNTVYGIQNLEYDEFTQCMFAAVYEGQKEKFPNYPMYVIDMKKPATYSKHNVLDESCEQIQLAEIGQKHEQSGVWGMTFPYGSTGIISLGNGLFYFSRPFCEGENWGTDIGLYEFDGKTGFVEK